MAAYDPFAQYQNAFQSIVPPQGTVSGPVQVTAPPADPGIARYQSFLIDQGINPNSIGTATIDRSTGRMVVPSVAQEYAAVNRNNQENALEGDIRKAARKAWRQGQTDKALEYENQVRELNNARGRSYEDRLAYFLAMARASTPPPIPSANGFS